MDKHLTELIKNNNRVIIPDLGAFLIRKQGDSQTISFNSIIKFDDGLFTGFISQKEKIDKKQAKDKLTEYTNKIKAELNKGNQFKVGTLGSLYKDANGKIQFIEGKGKPPAEAAGAAAAPKNPETKTEKPDAGPAAAKTEKKEEKKPVEPDKSGSKPGDKQKTVHERLQTSGKKPSTVQSKTTTQAKPKAAASKTTSSSGSGDNNKKILVGAGIALLVLGLFAVYWFVLKDKFFKEPDLPLVADTLPEIEEPKEDVATMETDSIVKAEKDTAVAVAKAKESDTKDKKEPKVVKASNKPVKKSYSGKQYYIVAGCFEVEQNADNYVNTLKQKGYDNARKFRTIGRLHAVCFDSYKSHQDALSALRKIQNNYESNAWMMEY